MNSPFFERLDRRTALKWMATAAASATLMPRGVSQPVAPSSSPTSDIVVAAYTGPGYGTDPDLTRDYAPGDWWPLTFDDHQRKMAAILCGLIIPADVKSPSAADLKVHDFIDEWISSPYPDQAKDRDTIVGGLMKLDAYSQTRFQANFADLNHRQHATLCDELAVVSVDETEEGDRAVGAEAKALRRELVQLRRFFKRFRDLTAGGFFTTPEGMKDMGYTGNVPLPAFPKPPEDLLKRLGLPVI